MIMKKPQAFIIPHFVMEVLMENIEGTLEVVNGSLFRVLKLETDKEVSFSSLID